MTRDPYLKGATGLMARGRSIMPLETGRGFRRLFRFLPVA